MKRGIINQLCIAICFSSHVALPCFASVLDIIDQVASTVTDSPTVKQSHSPSQVYSNQPSAYHSVKPSTTPSTYPSFFPTSAPSTSILPTTAPTLSPSSVPSASPSLLPSFQPTSWPSLSLSPTNQPSNTPTNHLSNTPSAYPSIEPSGKPSSSPSLRPSQKPSDVRFQDPKEFSQDGSNMNESTTNESQKNISYVIIGGSLGLVAIVAAAVLLINNSKRRSRIQNKINLFNVEDFEEDDDLENVSTVGEDDHSQFNSSTIQTEKTSVWKRRMQNILEEEEADGVSQIYPNSVFQASTIKSEGSWIRRTELPAAKTMQSSVMDIDFFEEKPIPDHVMCVQPQPNEEVS